MIKELTVDVVVEEFENFHKSNDLVNDILKCVITVAENGISEYEYLVSKDEYDVKNFETACKMLEDKNFAIEAVYYEENSDTGYIGSIKVFTFKKLKELPVITN